MSKSELFRLKIQRGEKMEVLYTVEQIDCGVIYDSNVIKGLLKELCEMYDRNSLSSYADDQQRLAEIMKFVKLIK